MHQINEEKITKLCYNMWQVKYMDKIIVKGARENNLKNINIELPKNKLIVMTGLSGSGKVV